MKIHPNSTLLMIGDSITDCGRARPVAEGPGGDLGNGYVALVNALLLAARPELRIRTRNAGVSGNTVRDLDARWQSDVLDIKPDWLSIMIGINDVWRQFDAPLELEWHVGLDAYASILEKLVRATRSQLTGLVLMTPYFIEPNRAEPMRAMMDKYGQVVLQLADKYHAIAVDTQAAFGAVLTELHPMALVSAGAPESDRTHDSGEVFSRGGRVCILSFSRTDTGNKVVDARERAAGGWPALTASYRTHTLRKDTRRGQFRSRSPAGFVLRCPA